MLLDVDLMLESDPKNLILYVYIPEEQRDADVVVGEVKAARIGFVELPVLVARDDTAWLFDVCVSSLMRCLVEMLNARSRRGSPRNARCRRKLPRDAAVMNS